MFSVIKGLGWKQIIYDCSETNNVTWYGMWSGKQESRINDENSRNKNAIIKYNTFQHPNFSFS